MILLASSFLNEVGEMLILFLEISTHMMKQIIYQLIILCTVSIEKPLMCVCQVLVTKF